MNKWRLLVRMDDFTRAYLEAALWAESDDQDEPLDRSHTIADFTLSSLKKTILDCQNFKEQALPYLNESGLDEEEQGRCFWLDRNGHGTGFWDRGEEVIFAKLSEISTGFGECWVYTNKGKVNLI